MYEVTGKLGRWWVSCLSPFLLLGIIVPSAREEVSHGAHGGHGEKKEEEVEKVRS